MKNTNLVKFILAYCNFMKFKIQFLKKYKNIIFPNNTINIFYCNKIISFELINDIFNLYKLLYQLIMSLPYNIKEISIIQNFFDTITSLLNEEIVSLCKIGRASCRERV